MNQLNTIDSLPDVNVTTVAREVGNAFPESRSQLNANALLDKLEISMTIGEDDLVEGNISVGKGRCIVIRGTLKGDVKAEGTVVLMKGGKVSGNITAGQAWIEGDVVGSNEKPCKIDAGMLHIGQNARVIGDCYYDQIEIASPNRGVRGRLESRQPLEGDING